MGDTIDEGGKDVATSPPAIIFGGTEEPTTGRESASIDLSPMTPLPFGPPPPTALATPVVRRGLGAEIVGFASEAVEDSTGVACEDDITAGTDVDLMAGGFAFPEEEAPLALVTLPGVAEVSRLTSNAGSPDDGVERFVVGVVFPGVRDLRSPAKSPGAGDGLSDSWDLLLAIAPTTGWGK